MNPRVCFLSAAFVILILSGCGKKSSYINDNGEIWHTAYHIRYDSDKSLKDSIMSIFEMVESSLSVFNDSSTVSRVNRNEITEIHDSMFVSLLNESKRIWQKSNGVFDPTLSPLIDLWGFGKTSASRSAPTSGQIDSVMNIVGLEYCFIDSTGHFHKKHPSTSINFSAIAKGYACDLIGQMFRRNGVANFIIEVGGELLLSGVNESGTAWRIFMELPVARTDKSGVSGNTISITDCAIATSGSYRNYHYSDGKTISHIIDPTTGHPIENSTIAVTVISQSCMTADALATACMILPLTEAIELIGIEKARARFSVLENGHLKIISTPQFPRSDSM